MTAPLDVVLLAAWMAGIVYVTRQTRRQPPSAARTGARGHQQRARSGNGGMSERFTPPPRYLPEVISVTELPRDELAAALGALTPALLCTLCVIELKQARAAGQSDPEVHPGVVMGEIVADGRPTVGVLCEVRHALTLATAAPAVVAPVGD